ncbi:MAG TPA: class I SAM-dependent methyltransferase [Geminicoccaceae bacterium]|nr:class I SAM-dependent methyltransferase [Geminicoccaceae bacterium]
MTKRLLRSPRWRRLGFGLRTVLGLRPPGGFFIPYRYAASVEPIGYGALEPRLAAALPACRELLAEIERHRGALLALCGPPPAPRFDQDWFPRLDAAAAYAVVRRCRPRRIVEVGSGHSTRFLARALGDGGLPDSILTCIDPAPRVALNGLAAVRRIAAVVQDAPEAVFGELEAGDILFVDSSHVLVPGSDVDVLLNRVLPALPAGALVHFHDVFLPDPYPAAWAWRGYGEQMALACLLQGGAYEVVFASRYLATRHAPLLAGGVLAALPLRDGAFESSLWLRKRAP